MNIVINSAIWAFDHEVPIEFKTSRFSLLRVCNSSNNALIKNRTRIFKSVTH